MDIFSLEDAARMLRKRKILPIGESFDDNKIEIRKLLLRVRTIYVGVSNIPRIDSKPVIYNIGNKHDYSFIYLFFLLSLISNIFLLLCKVLETLIFGIPRVAFKLIFVLGITMGIGYYIFVPKIYDSLRKFVEMEKRRKEEEEETETDEKEKND